MEHHEDDQTPLVASTQKEGGGGNEKGSVAVMWVLKAVACLMALDFMIVFLTVQQYWAWVGGSPGLYGLVFSSYSIAQFLFIIFVADYLDKHPMRNMLLVTVMINMIGNVIYMSGASAGEGNLGQGLIFVGRFVAGVGAANIVVGPYFIVRHTKDTTLRAGRIAVYNLYGFIGRVVGPILAFVILEYEPIINKPHFVMNQFTWPPLVTSIDCVIVLVMIFALLTPSRDPVPPPSHSKRSLRGGMGLKVDLAFLYGIHMLVLVIFWAWYANIVTIAAVQFNFATRYGSSMYWHAYIPVLVGFLIGTYSFKGLMKLKFNPVYALIVAMIFMIAGFVVMLDISIISKSMGKSDEARFWIGSILLTVGFNMESAAIPAIYSSIIDATGNEHIMARMLGVLTLFTCAGRSLGPIWTPLLLQVQESIYQSPSCCGFMDGAVGSHIENTCCKLHGINTMFIILCIASAVAAVGFIWMIRIQKRYTKNKELQSVIN